MFFDDLFCSFDASAHDTKPTGGMRLVVVFYAARILDLL